MTVFMPISETPKKIEFIMMKLSADEFVIASKVAFIESEENLKFMLEKFKSYNTLLFDYVDTWVYVVLSYQGYS